MAVRRDTAFASGGLTCAAWHYRSASAQAETCVVMAHGFGGTRHYGLDAYARRFADAGFDALLFDYRHFGDSEGEPRGLLKVSLQHEDWRAAVAHARALGYGKVMLWGSSFAGGHVLHTAAHDPAIAGVIAQVPHISGMATARAKPLRQMPQVLGAVIADAMLSLFGRRYTIKAFGREGEFAAMATPGAHDSLVAMLPEGEEWLEYFERHNRVTALALLEALRYSPGSDVAKIACPVLLQAGKRDRTTPFAPAQQAAARIRDCTFEAYDADHFDVYLGDLFEQMVAAQIDFLTHQFKPAITEPRQCA